MVISNEPKSVLDSKIKRRRGRPCGAQTAVVVDGQLGNHHFAFLRAMSEGIDPGRCAERYLLGQERVDPRTAKVIEGQLLERVITVAKAMNDIELRQAGDKLEKYALASFSDSSNLPTLDEFADSIDADQYSQNELLELYKEQYGDTVQTVELSYKEKIKALNYLQSRLAKTPKGEDSLAQWMPTRVCAQLKVHGVLSIDNLITFINLSGRTWYRLVPRLGRDRAARLMSWLWEVQPACQEKLHKHLEVKAHADDSHHHDSFVAAPNSTVVLNKLALVPLEQLFVPEHLDGHNGVFRTNQINTLGANTDLQAIEAWLTLLSSKSKHTQIAYKREIERFYLWALLERNKALSSLDALDCAAYADFLLNPPAHWVCALPYPRNHAMWRPYRGGLTHNSAQRSQAAIARLFSDLVSAQYLRANPMPRMFGKLSAGMKLDVMRSFTMEDQDCIAKSLATLPDTASGRRTRALIMLLMGSGLRVSETQTNHAAMIPLRDHDRISELLGLRVIGKGNKERIIPLRADLIMALKLHQADLIQVCNTAPDLLPLIGTLAVAPTPTQNTELSLPGNMLSVSGMYAIIKRFFATVAKHHSVHADFAAASAHWMRHTFAHQVLEATVNDLPVVQQLLGHSSIQTTAIYVKANMHDRMAAINAMQSPIFTSNTKE